MKQINHSTKPLLGQGLVDYVLWLNIVVSTCSGCNNPIRTSSFPAWQLNEYGVLVGGSYTFDLYGG